MSGKDYYAMLSTHTLVHAAMLELHWRMFEHWLMEENKGQEELVAALSQSIHSLTEAFANNERVHSNFFECYH